MLKPEKYSIGTVKLLFVCATKHLVPEARNTIMIQLHWTSILSIFFSLAVFLGSTLISCNFEIESRMFLYIDEENKKEKHEKPIQGSCQSAKTPLHRSASSG